MFSSNKGPFESMPRFLPGLGLVCHRNMIKFACCAADSYWMNASIDPMFIISLFKVHCIVLLEKNFMLWCWISMHRALLQPCTTVKIQKCKDVGHC